MNGNERRRKSTSGPPARARRLRQPATDRGRRRATPALSVGAIAFAGILLIVVARLLDPEMLEGWASAMTATIFMGAVNLIFLGVIAEYLGRVYDEAKQRPLYLVSDRVAAPPDGDATDAATAETPTDS